MAVGVAHLVTLDGAILAEVETLCKKGGVAMNGVVEYNGAVGFQSGVDDGHFAEAVEAATVYTLRRELENEGVLRGCHLCTVGADGVALVDGEALEVGVVSDEGLALVSIGGDGTVAQKDNLLTEADVHGAVTISAVAATDEVVFGVGLAGLCGSKGGGEEDYSGKNCFFHVGYLL